MAKSIMGISGSYGSVGAFYITIAGIQVSRLFENTDSTVARKAGKARKVLNAPNSFAMP
jgi:hypothetical protein